MAKKKSFKSFWKNIRFKYRLSVTNENTLEEIFSLRISKFNGLSVLFSTLLIVFLITAVIIVFTPLRNYLPGYMNSETRRQIVANALAVDSLQSVVDRQNLYITNIQDIFSGTVRVDTVQSIDSLTIIREDSLRERSKREEEFRLKYEEQEKYNLTSITTGGPLKDIVFYRPVIGVITGSFDATKRHFGTDIAADPKESILAVLAGTVVLSTYTAETGYVIEIQHDNGYISVYKHCGSLLKRAGEEVRAGEAIALVGDTGSLSTGPHLHFELWYRGQAIDPELYIVF